MEATCLKAKIVCPGTWHQWRWAVGRIGR